MSLFSKTLALGASALIALSSLGAGAHAEEGTGQQLFPLFSYRTGPYAPSGIPQWAGYRDYFNYINANGGVNGVKIFVQECETAYTLERAFECYERYKNGYAGAPVAVLFTTSSGFDAAVSDKAGRTNCRSSLSPVAAATPSMAASFPISSRCCSTTGPRPQSSSITSLTRWAATTS
jgi:hypothetical protein